MPDEAPLPELTTQRIEAAIRGCINRQDELTRGYTTASADRAAAEAKWKLAFAEARIAVRSELTAAGTKITVDVVDDEATQRTTQEYAAYLAAEAVEGSKAQALRTCRTAMDGFRSLLASHREGV